MIEPLQISWAISLNRAVNWKSTHINFIDIQMTNGYVVLDAPMSLLAKIPHNIHSELVIWNVNCFPIVASNYRWWPPPHMLAQYNSLKKIRKDKFNCSTCLVRQPTCWRHLSFKVEAMYPCICIYDFPGNYFSNFMN